MNATLVGALAFVIAATAFAVACAHAFAAGDPDAADDDVYCPHCDGTDLYDFDGDWWACHGCQMLFKVKEPQQ